MNALQFRLLQQRRRASGGGATTIASDDFNRADNPTGLGTTSVGAKVWTNMAGGTFSNGLRIVSNAAGGQDTGSDGSYIDVGVSDYTVSIVINSTTDIVGLLLAVGDNANWIRAVLSSGTILLRKVIGGSGTTITSPAVTWVSGDTLAVVKSGDTFTIKQNGTTRATVTDANVLASNTKVGLYTESASIVLDSFLVTTP